MRQIQKNIIIKALCIRQERGENLVEILSNYKKLTELEKTEILKKVAINNVNSNIIND